VLSLTVAIKTLVLFRSANVDLHLSDDVNPIATSNLAVARDNLLSLEQFVGEVLHGVDWFVGHLQTV
jgi:hypothetical protein